MTGPAMGQSTTTEQLFSFTSPTLFPELYHPKSTSKSALPIQMENLPTNEIAMGQSSNNTEGKQTKFVDLLKPEIHSKQLNKDVSITMMVFQESFGQKMR